jgi:hypothetical protein
LDLRKLGLLLDGLQRKVLSGAHLRAVPLGSLVDMVNVEGTVLSGVKLGQETS